VSSEPPHDSGLLTRLYTWPQRHKLIVDGVLALGLWVLFLATSAWHAADYLLIGTVQTLPLVLRRRAPTLVFTVVSLACALQLVLGRPLVSDVGFLVAIYSLSAYGREPRLRWAGLGVGVLGAFLALFGLGIAPTSRFALLLSFGLLVGLPVISGVAGDVKRSRLRVVSHLTEQNAALRRDRDQRAQLAAQAERARIAREMHDIVAHSLSVVVVQADGAAYAAEHSPAWTRSQAAATLQTIGATAREALDETRRLVGVLRESGDGATEYAQRPLWTTSTISSSGFAPRVTTSAWTSAERSVTCPAKSSSRHTGSFRRPSPTSSSTPAPRPASGCASSGATPWSWRSPTTVVVQRPWTTDPATASSACASAQPPRAGPSRPAPDPAVVTVSGPSYP
jgi:signal transduction histidine kinase